MSRNYRYGRRCLVRRHVEATCPNCGKTPLSRNEIGINKKLLGNDVERPMCIVCLAEYLDVPEDDLLAKIEEFKAQGCKLFG